MQPKSFSPSWLLGALLVGCISCSSASDPGPAVSQNEVTVRVTGRALDGLGAELRISALMGEDGSLGKWQPQLASTRTFASQTDTTYAVAMVPHYAPGRKHYDFTAELHFVNVNSPQSIRASDSSRLHVQWLVNGQPVPPGASATETELTSRNNGQIPHSQAEAYLYTSLLK